MMIRYEYLPTAYEQIVEKANELVQKSGILNLQPYIPEQAFKDAAMGIPSVHIRIAYANDTRWAAAYALNDAPKEVLNLIRSTKKLAKLIMQENSNKLIDSDAAHAYLDPKQNTAQKESPSVIVKIKVHQSGSISANGQDVSLLQLGVLLNDLKEKHGEVWYFRESPDSEPSEQQAETIKREIDAITKRDLPVRLQTDEY